MGFIDDIRKGKQARKDAKVLAEEKLYEHIGNEIESGEIRSGLWVKATSIATSSDPEDINREYIRLRVEHLQAEGRLYQQLLEEASEAVQKVEQKPSPEPSLKTEPTMNFATAKTMLNQLGYKYKDLFWTGHIIVTSPDGEEKRFKGCEAYIEFAQKEVENESVENAHPSD